jgi:hypothetical protein
LNEHFATQLKESTAAVFMCASLKSILRDVDTSAYKIYRDRLLVECGNPSDPIEIMIIEQLAFAHLHTSLLHHKASNHSSIDCVAVYLSAAARLMGEFRRSALALQAYRSASRQLAIASPKDDLIVSNDLAGPEDESEKNHDASKMGSTPRDNDDERPVIPLPRAAAL